MKIEEVRNWLEAAGIPGDDEHSDPVSDRSFPDGAHYRMEITGIERPRVFEAALEEVEKRNVPIHRVIATDMGSTLLDRNQLGEMAKMAADAGVEVIITPGPRNAWDGGRQFVSSEGGNSPRLRGSDQLACAITDIMRSIDQGLRGFLVTDEGLLWLLGKLKEAGKIPEEVVFKASIYTGHGSPAGAKMLEKLGANTFNPVADLTMDELVSIRKSTDLPLDLHIAIAESFGGMNRFYETPKMVERLAPCYFKIEPGASLSEQDGHYHDWISLEEQIRLARNKIKYAEIVKNIVEENYPEGIISEPAPEDLAIPEV